MAADQLVQARLDGEVKAQAAEALKRVGLTVSDAIRILFTRCANEGRLPFELMPHDRSTPESKAAVSAGEWLGEFVNQATESAPEWPSVEAAFAQCVAVNAVLSHRLPGEMEEVAEVHLQDGQQAVRRLASALHDSLLSTQFLAWSDARSFSDRMQMKEHLGRGFREWWPYNLCISGFDFGSRMWIRSLGTGSINPTVMVGLTSENKDQGSPVYVEFSIGDEKHLDPFLGAVETHADWVDRVCAAGGLSPFTHNVVKAESKKDLDIPSIHARLFREQFVRPALATSIFDHVESMEFRCEVDGSGGFIRAGMAAVALSLFARAAIDRSTESMQSAFLYASTLLRFPALKKKRGRRGS